jgi:two-component system, OmpR family, sensor histidine kinase KdpD
MMYSLSRSTLAGLVVATAGTAILTGLLAPFRDSVGLLNVGFIFMLSALLVASIWGRGAGLYAAVVANLAFNFFFIEPLHKFDVQEPRNAIALLVFLGVSVIGSTLLSAARQAAAQARLRQAETEMALRLSRAMSGHTDPDQALQALCEEVRRSFAVPGAAVLTAADDGWGVLASAGGIEAGRLADAEERATAQRAVSLGALQGLGETGLNRGRPRRIVVPRGREAAFSREHSVALVPLRLGERVLGVLRVDGPFGQSPFRDQPEPLLNAVASEAALAVQRTELSRAAAHAEALKQADAMKTALIASISHDLKTPLAGIKAAITSVLDRGIRWSDDDLDAFYRAIDSQADRLNRVISDVLDLNRIEAGALTPDKTALRALPLLQKARDVTAMETAGREVTVVAPPSLRAIADESLITQALINLIENAAKYSKPDGAIHLEATPDSDSAIFTVTDEGPGIAREDLPHIFERFYRAEEHSRRIKGSGLGLTIVKGFVELCGGSVDVENSASGTRFIIRLPAAVNEKVNA